MAHHLLHCLQSSLAELRLEVSAAQQISNHAASQLPHLSKSADHQHLQWDLYGASAAAVSPRISASMPGEANAGDGIMRQHALMRHLQESVASHTSQIASVEGTPCMHACMHACKLSCLVICGFCLTDTDNYWSSCLQTCALRTCFPSFVQDFLCSHA